MVARIHSLCNKVHLYRNNPLIIGTIILSLAGFISRFIGFFYRIFLSQTFGAEQIGIYQMIAPVLAISFTLSASGIQTAISKLVAEKKAMNHDNHCLYTFIAGSSLSLFIAILISFFCYTYSDSISSFILKESRCAPLLRVLSLSLPLSAFHSCIHGYFYGTRQIKIPAFNQLVEQSIRVGSVWFLLRYCESHQLTPTITFAIIGILLGELGSTLLAVLALCQKLYTQDLPSIKYTSCLPFTSAIIKLSTPLTLARATINILQSIEAIYIPASLISYGFNRSTALGIYGVLTGMSLPFILFPGAFISSICLQLLPLISEANSINNEQKIKRTIQLSIKGCLYLGFVCTIVFLISGPILGNYIFHNKTAGTFIMILSFLCPFLYVTNTLSSILNGLGKTTHTFFINLFAMGIRLIAVFCGIPKFGIYAFLISLLVAQLLQTVLCINALKKYIC